MQYFLKRCGFQELGSVGPDGKPKRGRYLMTSLHDSVVNFFPPLSKTILNDTALLPVIPLYTGKKTYCNYVYHNSKYLNQDISNPRNEYRIYLNNEIDNHCYYISSEDIVIIRKTDHPYKTDKGDFIYYYFLDVIKDHSSVEYLKYSRIIESSPIKGSYAIFDGYVDFFEEKVAILEPTLESANVEIDKSVLLRLQKGPGQNISSVFNSATFRDFVLAGYKNSCAISDECEIGSIDVVYIKPLSENGGCMPNNGIALSKSLSLAFLRGEFTISDTYEIIIHPDVVEGEILKYKNKYIKVPALAFFRPSAESLKYHQEHIFGSFLN